VAYQITAECKGCAHCTQWCPTGAIVGRRKVRFSIDVRRCIECGVCGRICTFGAVLTSTGVVATRLRRSEWEKPQWNYAVCDRCGDCVKSCPSRCVQMADCNGPESVVPSGYPFLSRVKLCIGCGFCARSCPQQAISLEVVSQLGLQ